MRVTESLLLGQLTNNVQNSSSAYSALQQELATGRKINQASDDPNGASQAMTVRGLLVDINQYKSDATSATNFLNYTDSQLNAVQNLVQQARTVAVAAANGGTQTADTQASYSSQVQSIIDQITTLANSDYAGRKLFSGQQTKTNPYTPGDATHTYHGDDGALTSTIGKGNSVQINVPGDQVFQPAFTALEQLKTDITGGNYSAISNNDLTAIDQSLSTLSQTRASVGSNINTIQDTSSMLSTAQQNYQTNLSGLEDADIATVYTQLQVAQNVYQASLIATSKAMQYSLADYIK